MERILKKLTSARFLMAIIFTLVTSYLAVQGTITGEQFIPLATMIIAFYFTKDNSNKVE